MIKPLRFLSIIKKKFIQLKFRYLSEINFSLMPHYLRIPNKFFEIEEYIFNVK
jgi:hypothetical protein